MVTQKYIRSLTGHKDWVSSVSFSPDGKIVASASRDGTIKLWDPKTGELKDSFVNNVSKYIKTNPIDRANTNKNPTPAIFKWILIPLTVLFSLFVLNWKNQKD